MYWWWFKPWDTILKHDGIDGLVQDCSNSSALAMELLQSCSKPSSISWYGNTFSFTCPLWGESTSHRWIALTKDQYCRSLMFALLLSWASYWTNSRVDTDFRYTHVHVMSLQWDTVKCENWFIPNVLKKEDTKCSASSCLFGQIINKPTLVQKITLCAAGNKPLSESMMA